jgi:hypothetical protein
MAHRYNFVGDLPAVLVGLIQGENAELIPAEGHPVVPHGATVTAAPGDVVETDDEYSCAFLQEAPKPAKTHKPKPETTPTSEGADK